MGAKKIDDDVQKIDRQRSLRPEVISIIVIGICFLVIISVFSGNGQNSADFSQNVIGFLGGLTCWLLKGLFGIGAYVLPFGIIALCVSTFFSETRKIKLSKIIMSSILFFILISFMHIVGGNLELSAVDCFKNGGISNGGFIGCVVGYVLCSVIGQIGTCILFVLLAIILAVMITGKSFMEFLRNCYFKLKDSFEKDDIFIVDDDSDDLDFDEESENEQDNQNDVGDVSDIKKKTKDPDSQKKNYEIEAEQKQSYNTEKEPERNYVLEKKWGSNAKKNNFENIKVDPERRVIERNGRILSINIPKNREKNNKGGISLFTDEINWKNDKITIKTTGVPDFLKRKKNKVWNSNQDIHNAKRYESTNISDGSDIIINGLVDNTNGYQNNEQSTILPIPQNYTSVEQNHFEEYGNKSMLNNGFGYNNQDENLSLNNEFGYSDESPKYSLNNNFDYNNQVDKPLSNNGFNYIAENKKSKNSRYDSPEFKEKIIENLKERYKDENYDEHSDYSDDDFCEDGSIKIEYDFGHNRYNDADIENYDNNDANDVIDVNNEFNDDIEDYDYDDTVDDDVIEFSSIATDDTDEEIDENDDFENLEETENFGESEFFDKTIEDNEVLTSAEDDNNIDNGDFSDDYKDFISYVDDSNDDENLAQAVSDYFNGDNGFFTKPEHIETEKSDFSSHSKNNHDEYTQQEKVAINALKDINNVSRPAEPIKQGNLSEAHRSNESTRHANLSDTHRPKTFDNVAEHREFRKENISAERHQPNQNLTSEREQNIQRVQRENIHSDKADEPQIFQAEKQNLVNENQAEKEVPKKEYVFPPISYLEKNPVVPSQSSREEIIENSNILVRTLKSFNVDAKVIEISKGPTVTRYELSPAEGIKVSKILGLADNLAMSLAAKSIRIEAPIPGKAAVGIEIPNKEVTSVYLSEVICDPAFQNFKSKVAFGLGKDITGNVIVADIAKMPHMLIAGRTGSGKSVCINTLIASILYKSTPEEVKLIMVDPKVVELSIYNGIPHLLIPVVTEPEKAAGALNWAVSEMMNRYELFAKTNSRNLVGYNNYCVEHGLEKIPQIIIIIDELADLMMVASKEVEASICRLAQLARAAGIHLIIATQRPSVDVITGLIKANIPSRIAFAVSSATDSRTILDMGGAEKLLGMGDMLFKSVSVDSDKPVRIQGAFISDKDVERIVEFIKENNPFTYDESLIEKITSTTAGGKEDSDKGSDDSDELIDEAIEFVVRKGSASGSMLQRKFKIGYNRAARIMDELADRGIIGPETGNSKPRAVLMNRYEFEDYMQRRSEYI